MVLLAVSSVDGDHPLVGAEVEVLASAGQAGGVLAAETIVACVSTGSRRARGSAAVPPAAARGSAPPLSDTPPPGRASSRPAWLMQQGRAPARAQLQAAPHARMAEYRGKRAHSPSRRRPGKLGFTAEGRGRGGKRVRQEGERAGGAGEQRASAKPGLGLGCAGGGAPSASRRPPPSAVPCAPPRRAHPRNGRVRRACVPGMGRGCSGVGGTQWAAT